MAQTRTPSAAATLSEARELRSAAARACADEVVAITGAAAAVARRLRRGGTLFTLGAGEAGTDAQHVAVEFVHPVVVGKPALPAIALANDAPTLSGFAAAGSTDLGFGHQLRCLARPDDVVLGLAAGSAPSAVLEGLRQAKDLGLLTVALLGTPPVAPLPYLDHVVAAHSDDERVVKEMNVTTYHVLWELVHLMLEHPDEGDVR